MHSKASHDFGFFLMILSAMFLTLALIALIYSPLIGIPALLVDLLIMYCGVRLLVKGKRGVDAPQTRACVLCGRTLPTRNLEFKEVRCYLLVRKEREVSGALCQECAERVNKEFQSTNLAKGWWSLPGLFRTPMLLMFNSVHIRRARAMAKWPSANSL